MGHTGVADLIAQSQSLLVFDDGDEVDASQLVASAHTLAAALRAQGFAPGDRVVMHRGNDRTTVELLIAAALADLCVVAVNTRYSADEVDDLVTRSGARHPDLGDHSASTVVSSIGNSGVDRRHRPFIVFTTSGTTAKPKMVMHRQDSIVDHAVDAANAFAYSPDDTVLVALPLCGTFGLTSLMAAIAGNTRVIVHTFDLRATVDITRRERITSINGSDDMFHRLFAAGADLSALRLGGYAQFNAALTDITLMAEMQSAVLTGLYGMSEVQALFALRDPSLDTRARSRAGGTLVSPHAHARVVDGELQVRGPSLFAGYLREGGDEIDAELTDRHVIDDDGATWFRTGDLAEMDDGRTFHYISRLGDVLRLGGFLVAPAEITDVLVTAPGVTGAQVVAVDRESGTRPVAFVTMTSDADFDEESIIAHCGERLARYKVPVRVVPVDEFPVTDGPNGVKIRLTALRARARELLAD